MSDAPVVNVDLAEMWADPYPILSHMRAETPICFVPEMGATLFTRRDDIHTCEKNVAVFSSDQPGGLMNELMGKNMMRRDGDEHRKDALCTTQRSRRERSRRRGRHNSRGSPKRYWMTSRRTTTQLLQILSVGTQRR